MQVAQEDTVTLETGANPGQALAAEFAVGSNLPLTWDEEARAGRGYENACHCISANVCGPLGARRLGHLAVLNARARLEINEVRKGGVHLTGGAEVR